MLLSIWVVKRSTEKDKYTQDRGECIEAGESDLLCAESREIPHALADDMNKEYGSLEEVSLLSTFDEHKSNTSDEIMINSSSKRRIPINETSTTPGNCLGWCNKCLVNYCNSLRLTTDLLVICLMVTLLRNLLEPSRTDTYGMYPYLDCPHGQSDIVPLSLGRLGQIEICRVVS
jgi:hypothetical protein